MAVIMPSTVSGRNDIIKQIEESIETDRYGVDICTRKVLIPNASFPSSLEAYDTANPDFSTMLLSKRSASREMPGFWSVVYRYEGYLDALPDPVYELTSALDQEPIQCHPKFVSTLAGTPSAPLNGAVFVDPATGKPTADDDKGIFREFRSIVGGDLNPKGGIESFLTPGAEWRETSITGTKPTEIRNLGTIDSPTGENPTLTGRNWLLWSHTYTKRGMIYQVTTVWKLSALREWDSDIYTD